MGTLLDRLNGGATVDAFVVYDTVDAAFIQANSAYLSQNTTGIYANSAYIHANSAYELANTNAANNTPTLAYLTANAAFIQANIAIQYAESSGDYANSAFISQNLTNTFAVSAYDQANTATTNAATADQRAVTSGSYANSAYSQANTGTILAQAAFNYANNSIDTWVRNTANAAFIKANNSIQSVSGVSGIIHANTSGNTVSINLVRTAVTSGSYGTPTTYPIVTVDDYGRITGITTQTVTTSTNQTTFGVTYAYDKFNGDGSTLSFNLSRSISGANTVHVFVNGIAQEYSTVWDASGALLTFTSGSAPPSGTNNVVVEYLIQPGAVALIDTLTDTSNSTIGRAATPLAVNTVYQYIQTSGSYANSAYGTSNSASSYANSAFSTANSASSYANSAFSTANSKFNSSGGTISGAVNISSGGLSVTGEITATGDVTAYYSSDKRLKENIIIIDSPLDKIDSINGVYFNWNKTALEKYPEKTIKTEIGVIAQEIEKVLPEVVAMRQDGYYAVRYEQIIALLIEGIKELRQEINQLKGRDGIN